MTQFSVRGQNPAFIESTSYRPWKTILPPVYRYIEKQYADEFFDTGRLRLSSFEKFRQHKDEARGDVDEGSAHLIAQRNSRHFGASVQSGMKCYALCGSTILSKRVMSMFDGADAVIEVTNTLEFGHSIARQLSGFRLGISGHCIYGGRILSREYLGDPSQGLRDEDGNVSIDRTMNRANEISQDEDFFLKDMQFQSQSEYRWMWEVDDLNGDEIYVHSLDAQNFCRPIDPREIR